MIILTISWPRSATYITLWKTYVTCLYVCLSPSHAILPGEQRRSQGSKAVLHRGISTLKKICIKKCISLRLAILPGDASKTKISVLLSASVERFGVSCLVWFGLVWLWPMPRRSVLNAAHWVLTSPFDLNDQASGHTYSNERHHLLWGLYIAR